MTPARRKVVREVAAVLGFVLILGPYVVMFEKLGWLGWWITTSILTGTLLIFLTGLPKFLTEEIRLPKDTRERLGWDRPKHQP